MAVVVATYSFVVGVLAVVTLHRLIFGAIAQQWFFIRHGVILNVIKKRARSCGQRPGSRRYGTATHTIDGSVQTSTCEKLRLKE